MPPLSTTTKRESTAFTTHPRIAPVLCRLRGNANLLEEHHTERHHTMMAARRESTRTAAAAETRPAPAKTGLMVGGVTGTGAGGHSS